MFSCQDFDYSNVIALIKVFKDIHLYTDSRKAEVLVLLDLSAVFNTVYHNIVLYNFVGIGNYTFECTKITWSFVRLHS